MAGNSKYVVLSDAVVVTTGPKPNGKGVAYTRILRGGIINGPETSETIKALVSKGAIQKVTSREEASTLSAKRRTVREVAQAMGAPDDPVEAPQEAVVPLDAPVPENDPEALLKQPEPADA